MKQHPFILAIDQGTTGTTALVIDVSTPSLPIIVGRGSATFRQYYPETSWVEHDLREIWMTVEQSVEAACADATLNHQKCDSGMRTAEESRPKFAKNMIVSIGITNQRETLCFFDRKSLEPAHKAVVWQCKRSSNICEELRSQGLESTIRLKTGLVIDPYFSGSKISWMMNHRPDIADGLRSKKISVGTVDAWLVAMLTSGENFCTEPSNASRTMLFNLNTGKWDSDLLEILNLPSEDILPTVQDSNANFGKTKGLSFLPDGIPLDGVLGDQQAALAGQACFEIGQGKCTYGTGAFLLVNQGSTPVYSNNGLLTTVAWSLDGVMSYAFEGSAFIAGASMQFLRDQLGFIESVGQIEEVATAATAAPDVYFVPALAGLGAPDWNSEARGAFLGLTRGTTKEQLVRAGLEGVSFQVCDLISSIESDLGAPVTGLRVDGGACANSLLMQIQSNMACVEVDRPENLETTAFGAAMIAGLGCGVYSDVSEISGARVKDTVFEPNTSPEFNSFRKDALAGWKRAKDAVQVFSGPRSSKALPLVNQDQGLTQVEVLC